ncbi:uncharacterized protein METZ01_LOCUS213809, partial [marine metagenome]
CKPPSRFAATAIRAGSSSQVLSMTSARCCACSANRNGPWWATHSRLGALSPTRLCFPIILTITLINRMLGCKPLWVSTRRDADSIKSCFRGGTTSTSTMSRRITCRSRRSTCCDTTRFTRGTARASTTSSQTSRIVGCSSGCLSSIATTSTPRATRRPMSRHCGRITRISSRSFSRPNSAG